MHHSVKKQWVVSFTFYKIIVICVCLKNTFHTTLHILFKIPSLFLSHISFHFVRSYVLAVSQYLGWASLTLPWHLFITHLLLDSGRYQPGASRLIAPGWVQTLDRDWRRRALGCLRAAQRTASRQFGPRRKFLWSQNGKWSHRVCSRGRSRSTPARFLFTDGGGNFNAMVLHTHSVTRTFPSESESKETREVRPNMSEWDFRGQYLYLVPAKIMCDFGAVMDSLSDSDWARFGKYPARKCSESACYQFT